MLIPIKNRRTPPAATMWRLGLNCKIAKIKQAKVDSSMPIKKQYNSISSFCDKTRCRTKKMIIQLSAKGKIRSFAVGRLTVSTFFKVFKRRYSRMGKITVNIPMENNLALIISIGRYLGDFEKKNVVAKSGINKGWKM